MDARSEALQKCLTKLAARDVELLTAYYESNTTAQQVAELLGWPVNTVYKALQRIRRALHMSVSSAAEGGDGFLPGQQLQLGAGVAEILFGSGARTILHGPCMLRIESAVAARLESGRLVGHVSPEAAGFAVRTPTTTVVDVGTEFGLEVHAEGTTDIVVFSGEADVARPPGEDPATARAMPESVRLTDGQRARVASDRLIADPQIDLERFVRNAQLTRLARRVALREEFAAGALDQQQWRVLTWAPNSAMVIEEGQCRLVNRGYLATAEQFDPVALGGIRITSRWQFINPSGATGNQRINIMTVVVRGDAEPGDQYFETRSGIRFTYYSSSRWASISSSGKQLETTKDRKAGNLEREKGDTFQFEIVDDGKNLSFKLWDPADPQHVAQATATVVRDTSESNYIIFYCRELQPPDWTYKVLLDDVVIETGVGPVR